MVFLRLRDSRAEMRFCSRRSRRCFSTMAGSSASVFSLVAAVVGLVSSPASSEAAIVSFLEMGIVVPFVQVDAVG